jgi:glycosyltransferase involved in cell wall biosynthesis
VSAEKAILLLGRRDEPTDGVADYCEKLREAGGRHGLAFEIAQARWAELGWSRGLAELREAAAGWRGRRVLLQFTTLAWSSRGFPLRVPHVLEVLRQCSASPAVVFHDFNPVRGSGLVGSVRAFCQSHVLRQLYARADLAFFTVPVEKIEWVPPQQGKALFIPVGSNFPELGPHAKTNSVLTPSVFTIGIFGITGGTEGAQEVADIVHALRSVHSKGVGVRLVAIGRGSSVFENELRRALSGSGIELSMLGLLPANELVQALASAQVLLCVRGHVSSRRGSAIAGIVCGVPIVGYRGAETGFPITEAGVNLVDRGDQEGLAHALAQVLTDRDYYLDLTQRSLAAAKQYFSWDAIASQFASALAGQRHDAHPAAFSAHP